jgi:hypothetical protein
MNRKFYKTAVWSETNEHVALMGFYGTGSDVQWKIRTISGEIHIVDEIELDRFVI